jgi:CRP/FNR family transcriptional regulator, cyclic AMP receptor protein
MQRIIDTSNLVSPIRGIVTFRFLSDPEIADLLDHSEALEFEEGEPIVEEGEVSPYFYGIASGTVAVSVGEGETKAYVNSLGAGEVFGEAGIFMSVPRTATVTAQERAVILRVHRAELAGFLKRHPDSGNKILLVFIYSLLRKLKLADQELAYERKSDVAQEDVDAMVANLFGEKAI